MSGLHVPTAGDHLLGSVGQILQMWGMKNSVEWHKWLNK